VNIEWKSIAEGEMNCENAMYSIIYIFQSQRVIKGGSNSGVCASATSDPAAGAHQINMRRPSGLERERECVCWLTFIQLFARK
jgi:hypothetical protein